MGPASKPNTVISRAAYAVGLVLLLFPVFGLATSWPFRIGQVMWRVQEFGAISSGLAPAMLGAAIILYTARSLEHGRTQFAIGVLVLIAAVAIAALLGNFIMDALEVRAQLAADAKAPFLRLASRAMLQAAAVSAAFFALGITGVAGARRQRRTDRARQTVVHAPPLIRDSVTMVSDG